MATGKTYYWMRLKESFLNSDTVDFFMSQPNGANYVVLYQALCLKTINTEGRLSRQIGDIIIPFDIEKIRRDCKWFSTDTIRVALELYKKFGLIYEDVDGTLVLADHHNLVGSETDYKEQKRKQRMAAKDRPKLTGACKRVNADTIMLPTGKTQFVDEKRYGGNGMFAFDLANGECEMCGATENLLIHHSNGYSNDIEDLYVLCKTCHGIAHTEAGAAALHHKRVSREGGLVHSNVHTEIRDIESRDIDTPLYPPTGGQKEKRRPDVEPKPEDKFSGELLDAVNSWLDYKWERNKSNYYKETGYKSLITQLGNCARDYGEAAVAQVIRYSMANNYQGICFGELKKGARMPETVYSEDSKALRAARYFAEQKGRDNPGRAQPTEDDLQRWADAMERLHQENGVSWKVMAEVMDYSLDSEWWGRKVQSAYDFKRDFNKIFADMTKEQGAVKED